MSPSLPSCSRTASTILVVCRICRNSGLQLLSSKIVYKITVVPINRKDTFKMYE